jgi:hypothetical protein
MAKESFIQVRVEPQLKQDLQDLADKDRREFSDYLRLVLIKHVEEEKKKQEK